MIARSGGFATLNPRFLRPRTCLGAFATLRPCGVLVNGGTIRLTSPDFHSGPGRFERDLASYQSDRRRGIRYTPADDPRAFRSIPAVSRPPLPQSRLGRTLCAPLGRPP